MTVVRTDLGISVESKPTLYEFFKRFTASEVADIRTSRRNTVKIALEDLGTRIVVNTVDQDTISTMDVFVDANILTQERADEILSTPSKPFQKEA